MVIIVKNVMMEIQQVMMDVVVLVIINANHHLFVLHAH